MYTGCRRSCRVCRCIPGIPCGSATVYIPTVLHNMGYVSLSTRFLVHELSISLSAFVVHMEVTYGLFRIKLFIPNAYRLE